MANSTFEIPVDMIDLSNAKVGDTIVAPGIPAGTPIKPSGPLTGPSPLPQTGKVATTTSDQTGGACFFCHETITKDSMVVILYDQNVYAPTNIIFHQTCWQHIAKMFTDPEQQRQQVLDEAHETYERYKKVLNGDGGEPEQSSGESHPSDSTQT